MPTPFIDDLFKNLNASEKRSINYNLISQTTGDDLLIRKYLQSVISTDKQKLMGINRMLRSRAFDQLTDSLTSRYHIQGKGNFTAQDQVLLLLKKKILFARVLSKSLNQNKMAPFKTILNTIITEAKKNEVYEVLIEALQLKKYFFALKTGARGFQKLEREIAHYEICQRRIFVASDFYFKIIINNNLLKFKNERLFHNYISKAIRVLKEDFLAYKSEQINYYLHIILMFYFERQKKYMLSAKYCKTLFYIVKKSPILYRPERLGFALDNLSQYKTFTGNYSDAAKHVKEAQKYYLAESNSYIVSKEQEFHIYFYHKKYERATTCINELLDHKLVDSGNFIRAKYIYFHATLLFAQKKYKQALQLLNKSLEIEKEKSKWNISLRILNIMLFIELDKTDEAIRLLETLRKFVERNKKKSEIGQRNVLIVKVFRALEKEEFVYTKNNRTISKMLKDLSNKNNEYAWEHYSPELLPFHEWLKERVLI